MNVTKKVYYYLSFIRFFTFLGTFAVFIFASIIAIRTSKNIDYSITKIFIGALSSGFLASAAYAINNIFDLEIDKINKPFRPLPSKKISLTEAWIITIILYFLSFLLAIYTTPELFFIVLIMAVTTIIYSCPPFRIKRFIILQNITIAFPRGLLLTLAGWSVIKNLFEITPWYIGFISFFFLVGATTTKDIGDLKGDKIMGCYTLPIKYGTRETAKLISPFFTLPFLLIPFGAYLGILKITTLPLTLLLFYGIYIIKLMNKKPKKLTRIELNHISWKHAYILYMMLQLGMVIAYII